MACTTDNATNNDTLMHALETTCKDKNIQFTVHDNHVRCLAHVINLAVQDALATLKVGYANNEDEILNSENVTEVIPKVCICILYLIL
jgi:hypothetical protein